MGFKAPKPPDPFETARAQAQFSEQAAIDAARINQFNEVTPFGSVTFSGAIGTPSWTRIISLNPTGQATVDEQQQLALTLAQLANQRATDLNTAPFTVPQSRNVGFGVGDVALPSTADLPQLLSLSTSGLPGLPGIPESFASPAPAASPAVSPATEAPATTTAESTTSRPTGGGGLDRRELRRQRRLRRQERGIQRGQRGSDRRGFFSGSDIDGTGPEQPAAQTAPATAPAPAPAPQQPASQQFDLAEQGNIVRDALFDQATGLLNPQFDRRLAQAREQLSLQGIPRVGSEAALGEFGLLTSIERERNRALNEAALSAILAGGQEQSRLFGLGLQGRQQLFGENLARAQQALANRGALFGERATIGGQSLAEAQLGLQAQEAGFQASLAQQQQDIARALTQRNQRINELAALIQGSPAIGQPTPNPAFAQGVETPNFTDAAFRAFNAQQSQAAAGNQAFGTFLRTAIGGLRGFMSSSFFKHDFEPVGDGVLAKIGQTPIYRWRYSMDIDPDQRHHIGPMAEDFADIVETKNDKIIHLVDYMGVLFAGLNEAARRIESLESELAELREPDNAAKSAS